MKLTVFGGTGNVGRHLIEQALEAGHEVTAFARSPDKLPRHPALTAVQGQLNDADAIAQAIHGTDAVVSALGARANTPDQVEVFGTAMQNITSAMQEQGIRRLVAISGAVVVLTPEDHVTLGRRLVRFILTRWNRYIAQAKEREYAIISGSGLDWVVVRPPRIVPGPATGVYRVFADRVPSTSISQGDVAHFMLAAVNNDPWVHRAPIPGY